MPRILNFTAKFGDGAISGGEQATAASFGGGSAAALGDLATTASRAGARFVQDMADQDQRKFIVGQAQAHQQAQKDLHDALMSGAELDPIRQKYEDTLSGLKSQMRTTDGVQSADLHTANSLALFDTMANNIVAERAGQEAKTQGGDLIAKNSVILSGNASYLPIAKDSVHQFVQTFKGKLSPQQMAAVEKELNGHQTVAAVRGIIQNSNPQIALDKLNAGEWSDLTPDQRAQLQGNAQTEVYTRMAREEHAIRFAEFKKSLDADKAVTEYTQNIFDQKFDPVLVGHDPRLNGAQIEHLIVLNKRWMDEKFGEGRKSNPTTLRDAISHVYAPETDPTKWQTNEPLLNAVAKGDLSPSDFRWLNADVAMQRDPNGSPISRQMYDAYGRITYAFQHDPTYLTTDGQLKAAQIATSWFSDVRQKVEERRKNPALGSLSDLFNPNSKDWVMRPDYVKQFVTLAKGGVRVDSPEAAMKLPPGTTVVAPDGAIYVTPSVVDRIPQ